MPFCRAASKAFGPNLGPQVVTLLFIAVWYGLNIGFNLRNKTIFNYFPFPWTVSAVHVVVGAAYCGITYLLGFKEASFGRVRVCYDSTASVLLSADSTVMHHFLQHVLTFATLPRREQ